jgi:pimeloyl-ACP methyl ester carboxylesterase
MAARLVSASALRVRSYGSAGSLVLVLHGGPGAPGYLAPLARGLADRFRVREPFQRWSGGEPLTVARHVEDLREVVASCAPERPALVGHSWGAMLALAFAAEHPDLAGPIVLVGCGTFDAAARERMQAIRAERLDDATRRAIEAIADPDERIARTGETMARLDTVERLAGESFATRADRRGHEETWTDALRLQAEGVHPAAFAAIRGPVLLLQGDFDSHPGPLIRASLAPHLPQLEYVELPRCGHYPWLERHARDAFFATLIAWLERAAR